MGRIEKKFNKKKKEKDALKLSFKETSLYEAKRKLGKVELDPPIRAGWEKSFVLREDCAKREDAHIYRTILKEINCTIVSRNKNFLVKDYQIKKMIPIEHKLKHLLPKEMKKIGWSENFINKYFNLVKLTKYNYFTKKDDWYWAYEIKQDFYFVPKIRPHYRKHATIRDSELESEIQEIKNKKYSNYLWPLLTKLLYGSYHKDSYFVKKPKLDEDSEIKEGLEEKDYEN
jgi:hypothetical protein